MRVYRNVFTCLGCLNLVMSGKDEEGRAKVRCLHKELEDGDPILLLDIIEKKVDIKMKCMVREGVGQLLPKGTTWAMHIKELRQRYCVAG